MNRRTALAAVVTGFGVTTAGCSGILPSRSDVPSGEGASTPPSGDEGGTNQSPSNENGSPAGGGQAGSGNEMQGGSSAAAVTCPSLPIDAGIELVCGGQQADSAVYLSAKRSEVSLPVNTIEFVLYEGSGGDVLYTPCIWAVYKQSNQGWQTVRPLEGDTISSILYANSQATLTLYIGQPAPNDAEPCGYSVDSLDAGRYLFGVRGNLPTGGTDAVEALFLASFRVTQ